MTAEHGLEMFSTRKELTYRIADVRAFDESLTDKDLLFKRIRMDWTADHVSVVGHEVCVNTHIGGKNCHREQFLKAWARFGAVEQIAQPVMPHKLHDKTGVHLL